MVDNSSQILHDLDARAQIQNVLAKLCQGVDRLDRELITSCYHPEAIDNHGAYAGSVPGFADWVIERHSGKIDSCMHLLGSVYIELDQDFARTESYVLALYRFLKDGVQYDMTAPGRYLDKFEKRNGQWKIVERLVVFEKDRLDPVTEKSSGPLTEMLEKSRRDVQDLAYQHFGRPYQADSQ